MTRSSLSHHVPNLGRTVSIVASLPLVDQLAPTPLKKRKTTAKQKCSIRRSAAPFEDHHPSTRAASRVGCGPCCMQRWGDRRIGARTAGVTERDSRGPGRPLQYCTRTNPPACAQTSVVARTRHVPGRRVRQRALFAENLASSSPRERVTLVVRGAPQGGCRAL